jgi:hypothetical protein
VADQTLNAILNPKSIADAITAGINGSKLRQDKRFIMRKSSHGSRLQSTTKRIPTETLPVPDLTEGKEVRFSKQRSVSEDIHLRVHDEYEDVPPSFFPQKTTGYMMNKFKLNNDNLARALGEF